MSLVGSGDGKVHMWSADSGKRVALLDGMHPGACQSVRFNPKYMMFATGCVNLVSISLSDNNSVVLVGLIFRRKNIFRAHNFLGLF